MIEAPTGPRIGGMRAQSPPPNPTTKLPGGISSKQVPAHGADVQAAARAHAAGREAERTRAAARQIKTARAEQESQQLDLSQRVEQRMRAKSEAWAKANDQQRGAPGLKEHKARAAAARAESAAREVVMARMYVQAKFDEARRAEEDAERAREEALAKQQAWRNALIARAERMASDAAATADAAAAKAEEAQKAADDSAAFYAGIAAGLVATAVALAAFALITAVREQNNGGSFMLTNPSHRFGMTLPLAAASLAVGGAVAALTHWLRRGYLDEQRRCVCARTRARR